MTLMEFQTEAKFSHPKKHSQRIGYDSLMMKISLRGGLTYYVISGELQVEQGKAEQSINKV